MKTRSPICALMPALLLASATAAGAAQIEPRSEVVPRSEVTFQPLNPARGDASPRAGVLWGDISKNVPTGSLIMFADGFSSPPHIHNITYRAVVISGAVHNDDPNAEKLWMRPGSFWTQPAGETHITAARGERGATAFLEILEGPYLVKPSDEAFDKGERPLNIEQGNVVWLDSADVTWVDQPGASASGGGPQMAFLWGSPQEGEQGGTFLKLPAGFNGELRSNTSQMRAVVITGSLDHQAQDTQHGASLEPGSYFGSKGEITHWLSCDGGSECILYVRTEGRYRVVQR